LFPEEAGEKKNYRGRKVRTIPYLPGTGNAKILLTINA